MANKDPQLSSPIPGSVGGPLTRTRSSTKLVDDVTSLTSFNPFSEDDENDQSSYALVTSLFSRMKNTFTAPLSSAVTGTSAVTNVPTTTVAVDPKRPSLSASQISQASVSSRNTTAERPSSLSANHANLAPPLVSLTPVVSETPSYNLDYDKSPTRSGMLYPQDGQEGKLFGTAIPGFPIQDDTRSIHTAASVQWPESVSRAIRRIRGEGLSRDYWMDDENCKECYDCESVFTTWRRKHHCRICGQIFCSRCASNIIKGTRFGHDGMIRVCNLCLEKLGKEGDDDDDDDGRSVVSAAFSFSAHQLGVDSLPLSLGHHPQSPFAASQLFGRTDEPFNLFSIATTKRQLSGFDDSAPVSRPITPRHREEEGGSWEPVHLNPAPFRRGLAIEEKDGVNISDAYSHGGSPTRLVSKTPTDFPMPTIPNSVGAGGPMSSIQFPMGSPDRGWDSPRPRSRVRSRFNSLGDFDIATPFIRSRVQSRLDDVIGAEPGWRTRRESTAYAQELNLASMVHLKVMLCQMLTLEGIPNVQEWEEILLGLAMRIARELTFTAFPHRQGEDMDVRRYVKIKKIPGGKPRDSEYVDGAVITKNVAHKQMVRFLRNPRIMLVTFPLEFYRVEGQYIHFGQILRQEKEYLGNLASRIAALRPHIVLAEKSVSRLVLEALTKQNIAIARNVKPSSIRCIARMTQGDVFSSMDKLALEPRLGHCARFRVQTYDHPLIPGQRKTYMRFEGCNRDMGCTIILRGENIDTLKSIKKVTRFLTFIVRNLKLETHLWKDSVITLPSFNAEAIPSAEGSETSQSFPMSSMSSSIFSTSHISTLTSAVTSSATTTSIEYNVHGEPDLPDEDAEQLRLSRRIQQSFEPYTKTFISVSATLRFPPPYPISRMRELEEELMVAKRAWEDEVIRREEKALSRHVQEATLTPAAPSSPVGVETHEDIKAQIEALPAVDIPVTPTPVQVNLPKVDDSSEPSSSSSSSVPLSMQSSLGSLSLSLLSASQTEALTQVRKSISDITLESRLVSLKWQHEEQRRIWEWYLRKNSDDFVVEKYQCISLWHFTIPLDEFGQRRACFAPQMQYITFYGENDCTLGQYIEKAVTDTLVQFLDPKAICAGKGCNLPLSRHCKVYVHHHSRLFVAVEKWDGQIVGRTNCFPTPELITTWSACCVCGSATPFIPVSEEMQRYSFAKFLELHFYPADVKLVQGAGCEHNIYQHHIRYFACKGMTVRFQTDSVTLHEIVYPPVRIRVYPNIQLELKNADFDRLHYRNVLWYTALIDDLKLISIDAATGDEEADARLTADINVLIDRAEAEREEISRLINQVYKDSSPTDTLALNQVRSIRQDKIVAWQQDFDRLPKPRPAQTLVDRSGRRAPSAFGSVRAMWPRKYGLSGTLDHPHVPSSSISEAEERSFRRVTGDSFVSSASEASESETNTENAVKETNRDIQTNSEVEDTALKSPIVEEPIKSDPDSDSTIEAIRDETISPVELPASIQQGEPSVAPLGVTQRASRLPRRSTQQPSVKELVKKYQEFLPPDGVQELAKTAFAPNTVISESEPEYDPTLPRISARGKTRHYVPSKKSSISDFEQSYAANVAPRYLTHSRRNIGHATHNSRIPGPIGESSLESSRRPSPEKYTTTRTHPDENVIKHVAGTKTVKGSRTKTLPLGYTGKSNFRRSTGGPKVSTITKHFERLNRDTERANRRYAVIRGRRARPVASARAKVEVLESIKDAIDDESESSDSSEADDEGDGSDKDRKSVDKISTESSKDDIPPPPECVIPLPAPLLSPPVIVTPPDNAGSETTLSSAQVQESLAPLSRPMTPILSAIRPGNISPLGEVEFEHPGTERVSILKAISGLWLQQQSRFREEYDAEDPMNDPEHIFRDSSMVVRTDEPTSIIALALNSPQYRDMLSKSRAEKRTAREPKLTDGGEAFMPDDRSVAESTSTWGVVNVETIELPDPMEELRVPSSKLPWAITFESGGLTISCTVLFPEQFDALRRTYDCEKSMIESLARCVKWNASGGKSGSAFLKTRDDRFVAKELSKTEVQTMESFAPAYFDYMSSAVTANRPTLLAKVFGCYKLTFKKAGKDKGSAKSKSMNLLVMENLLYNRRFSKIYDLKGSTRNRHVQSTGRENEVLLDENLVETAHLCPFYLREHSKRILRGALYNDSKFLADINVMDYSLVVGVDSSRNELVIGIVDYIRTYTWDKRLESWVKESAFLGGGGKGEPTIVTPKQYRQRFISAMERYFPLVPDRWMKQKDTPEEDFNLLELWPDW